MLNQMLRPFSCEINFISNKVLSGKFALPDVSTEWSTEEKVNFIESIAHGIPLAPLYIKENKDGTGVLLEANRINAFIVFANGELWNSMSEDEVKAAKARIFGVYSESRAKEMIEESGITVYYINHAVDCHFMAKLVKTVNLYGSPIDEKVVSTLL